MQRPGPENQTGSVYINGKKQIIEMLQIMDKKEKQTLLRNIRLRNPSLANELMEKSFSFRSIGQFPAESIEILAKYIDYQIIGVALKSMNPQFQRHILSHLPRDYAESAFAIMMKPLKNEKEIVKRAQNKILETLFQLSKKGLLTIS